MLDKKKQQPSTVQSFFWQEQPITDYFFLKVKEVLYKEHNIFCRFINKNINNINNSKSAVLKKSIGKYSIFYYIDEVELFTITNYTNTTNNNTTNNTNKNIITNSNKNFNLKKNVNATKFYNIDNTSTSTDISPQNVFFTYLLSSLSLTSSTILNELLNFESNTTNTTNTSTKNTNILLSSTNKNTNTNEKDKLNYKNNKKLSIIDEMFNNPKLITEKLKNYETLLEEKCFLNKNITNTTTNINKNELFDKIFLKLMKKNSYYCSNSNLKSFTGFKSFVCNVLTDLNVINSLFKINSINNNSNNSSNNNTNNNGSYVDTAFFVLRNVKINNNTNNNNTNIITNTNGIFIDFTDTTKITNKLKNISKIKNIYFEISLKNIGNNTNNNTNNKFLEILVEECLDHYNVRCNGKDYDDKNFEKFGFIFKCMGFKIL